MKKHLCTKRLEKKIDCKGSEIISCQKHCGDFSHAEGFIVLHKGEICSYQLFDQKCTWWPIDDAIPLCWF